MTRDGRAAHRLREMWNTHEPAPFTCVSTSAREQGAGSTDKEMWTMTRLQRLLRLAILRGDRAAEIMIRARMRPALTETELRMMWGDR